MGMNGNGKPVLETKRLDVELVTHTHSWEILVRQSDGTVGVAAFGPIESAPLIQHIFQAGGAIKREPPALTVPN